MDIEKIIKQFDEHVKSYDMNDVNIRLKYDHSYRVMDLCTQIAISLNLSDKDIELASVIGLLHDYARFEQWKRYGVYSDIKSVDHADLAVELLFKENQIANFDIPKEYYSVICDAVRYHNKLNCPENLNEYNKLFCEIVRDADKLDIIYLLGLKGKITKDDGREISDNVKHDFYSNKSITKSGNNSTGDNVLLRVALVYDLNFEYSYKHIEENKLMENFYNTLENKEKFKEYFNYIYKYIENYFDERKDTCVRKKI